MDNTSQSLPVQEEYISINIPLPLIHILRYIILMNPVPLWINLIIPSCLTMVPSSIEGDSSRES